MCYYIDADFIMGNYFLHTNEPLTFEKLRDIRNRIKDAIPGDTCVDISMSSLYATVCHFPKLFSFSGKEFEFIGTTLSSQYVRKYLERGIDDSIRKQAQEAIQAA